MELEKQGLEAQVNKLLEKKKQGKEKTISLEERITTLEQELFTT